MEPVSAPEPEILLDARGLVELDDTIPKISEIDGDKAVLEARDLSTRKINAELRWLLYESDDIVALASEEIAIRKVVDREIETYDPYESEVMVWTR